jgi:hypothetical protein
VPIDTFPKFVLNLPTIVKPSALNCERNMGLGHITEDNNMVDSFGILLALVVGLVVLLGLIGLCRLAVAIVNGDDFDRV